MSLGRKSTRWSLQRRGIRVADSAAANSSRERAIKESSRQAASRRKRASKRRETRTIAGLGTSSAVVKAKRGTGKMIRRQLRKTMAKRNRGRADKMKKPHQGMKRSRDSKEKRP